MNEPDERGPIESEIHELIRRKNLGTPWMLDAGIGGRDLSTQEIAQQALVGNVVLMEALLRLAREVDDLRASR